MIDVVLFFISTKGLDFNQLLVSPDMFVHLLSWFYSKIS